jgi:transformation/transcription domain-associated protein
MQISKNIANLNASAASAQPGRSSAVSIQAFNDLRALLKTWRNRLPVRSDPLSHWSDLLSWRLVTFDHMNKAFANANPAASPGHGGSETPAAGNAVIGNHHTSQVR